MWRSAQLPNYVPIVKPSHAHLMGLTCVFGSVMFAAYAASIFTEHIMHTNQWTFALSIACKQARILRFSHTLARLQKVATAADGQGTANRHQTHGYRHTTSLLVVLAAVLLIVLVKALHKSYKTQQPCDIAFLAHPTTVLCPFAFWLPERNPPQVSALSVLLQLACTHSSSVHQQQLRSDACFPYCLTC
jgi:uncharacterized membrane protein